MAAELANLVPALKASLNAPGEEAFDATPEEWEAALASAFWYARLKRLFTRWRLNASDELIVPVDPDDDDMPRELQQVIVIMAAVNSLEAKLLTLETRFRVKSGGQEFETGQSAEVLRALLAAKRAELEEIREDLVEKHPGTNIAVIDMVVHRMNGRFGGGAWLTA